MTFQQIFVAHFEEFGNYATGRDGVITLTGRNLTLPAVVALSRNQVTCNLDAKALNHAVRSAEIIEQSLANKQTTYGVNTGFGGSANTRTTKAVDLQRLLMRGLNYGIMEEPLLGLPESEEPVACMPEAWSRAAMVIRLNSLLSGSSGVRTQTLEALQQLIDKNIVPRIPLRGSISASGDLSPLSYIGGTLQGKPTISVFHGPGLQNRRKITSARKALLEAKISPIAFQPKEGLAIVNGTAVSAGVAALAVHNTLPLYALSLLLTAMSTEALYGTDESFDECFARVRPHPGQDEAARLIRHCLSGSSLVASQQNLDDTALRQDRYSIRTASQWCGPLQEDLILSYQQILIELNSVTDNPLIDPESSRILHGGNFQAKAVTVASEKIRLCLQSLGRMLFTQCTEMINPATSRGLPPNLVINEPNYSFLWKGTDIMIAALTSELGFLANPVGTHVQTAEMGNQSLNSLALISSRYTSEAIDCLTQLVAAHLVAVCQALDIRGIQKLFQDSFKAFFTQTATRFLSTFSKPDMASSTSAQIDGLWLQFQSALERSMSLNTDQRFLSCMQSLHPLLFDMIDPGQPQVVPMLQEWTTACSEKAYSCWYDALDNGLADQENTERILGHGSRIMYRFVRQDLQVPCIHEDLLTTPPGEEEDGAGSARQQGRGVPKMGDYITRVYQSIREGKMNLALLAIFQEKESAKAKL